MLLPLVMCALSLINAPCCNTDEFLLLTLPLFTRRCLALRIKGEWHQRVWSHCALCRHCCRKRRLPKHFYLHLNQNGKKMLSLLADKLLLRQSEMFILSRFRIKTELVPIQRTVCSICPAENWSRRSVGRWQNGCCGKVRETWRRTIWSNQSWETSNCETGSETQKDHLCSAGRPNTELCTGRPHSSCSHLNSDRVLKKTEKKKKLSKI